MTTTADDSTTGRHIPALDGLRGTAILMVLYLHLFWSNTSPAGNLLVRSIAELRTACWIGVDLFFVLSGFLLTGILYDTLSSAHFFRNFYGRRSLRIFPLYYAFLFVVIAISYAQGYHWFGGTFYYLTYTVSLLRNGSVQATDAPWIHIDHFWSLAVEEQFYMAWPLLMYFLRTKRRIAGAIVVLALTGLLVRTYLVLSGVTVLHPYSVYAWSPARFDTLLLGGLLALAIRSRFRGKVLRWSWLVFVCGASVLTAYGFRHGRFDALTDGVVATIGLSILGVTGAALVGASLTRTSMFSAFFSNPVLRFFGRYSYGLYVYHYTLQALMSPFMQPWLHELTQSKLLLVLLNGGIVLVTAILLAVLSFEMFEKRFLGLKRFFHDETPTPKLRQDVTEAESEATASA
jgi:peptidoglycan/LPS O-acetylase OafA/YrhL